MASNVAFVRRALGAVALLSLSASPTSAFCPHPRPRACAAFFESDVVFVGTVLSRRYTDESERIRFGFRTSRSLRGSVDRGVAVYAGNDSARPDWDVGREYVVFARRQHGRLVSADDCGLLSDRSRSREILGEIAALRHSTTSWVEGEVLRHAPNGPGIAGILVRVRGANRTYEGRSDDRGVFRISIPPGRYKVMVDPKLTQSEPYSSKDLNDIRLTRDQCAQLQFVSR